MRRIYFLLIFIYSDKTNTSTFSENSELENLHVENKLLKQLNEELMDKNALIKELWEKRKNVDETAPVRNNQKTYADIMANRQPIKSQRVPRIIVKSLKSENKDPKEFSKKVCNLLIEKKDIQTKQVKSINDSEIEIKSMNEKSAKATIELLSRKLSNNYKTTIEKIESPKFKIVGVDNYNKMNLEDLEKDLNNRHFNEYDEKCKVLYL
ncbi:uncharacterized protein LOC116417662 [Nasonia vitripennis]|uniref:Uncharacterized protein n=1 Tax=Nasonia vitripennis TaxID=7425 RepID=A0A7M7TAS2_NASVI|nr:uncharacterized protein LOC116417662 [Nasonia vitripennis]